MTTNRRRELEVEAESLIQEKEYIAAGDIYVQASFEEAGEWFGSPTWAIELRMLFKACLCYRLAGQNRQYRFAAQLGIQLAEEYKTRIEKQPEPSHPLDQAERGVWDEFVGDFRLIADFGEYNKAYDTAKSIYREVGNPRADFAEGPIMSVQAIFSTAVLVAGADNDYIVESTQGRLTDWVDYKQEHLPELIEIIESSGEWRLDSN